MIKSRFISFLCRTGLALWAMAAVGCSLMDAQKLAERPYGLPPRQVSLIDGRCRSVCLGGSRSLTLWPLWQVGGSQRARGIELPLSAEDLSRYEVCLSEDSKWVRVSLLLRRHKVGLMKQRDTDGDGQPEWHFYPATSASPKGKHYPYAHLAYVNLATRRVLTLKNASRAEQAAGLFSFAQGLTGTSTFPTGLEIKWQTLPAGNVLLATE